MRAHCEWKHVVKPAKANDKKYCGMECLTCGDWDFCGSEHSGNEEHKKGCNCPVPVEEDELID